MDPLKVPEVFVYQVIPSIVDGVVLLQTQGESRMSYEIEFAHELDISWLIALWFAIHGGDPSPEGVKLEVSEETYALANGLVQHLLATYKGLGARALPEAELEARLSQSHCFQGGGGGGGGSGPICVELPGTGRLVCVTHTSP